MRWTRLLLSDLSYSICGIFGRCLLNEVIEYMFSVQVDFSTF
jgi:hypothetical protein